MMEKLEAHLWNNTWGEGNKLTNFEISPKSTFTDNTTGVNMCEEDIPVTLPVRPCPFILSAARKDNPADGYTLKLKALPEMTSDQSWEVRHNNDMDWFEVSPSKGVLHPGEEITLTLRLKDDKLHNRRIYRSAFIVRTPEGLSRPFSFYVNTDFVPPFHAEKKGETAIFLDVTKPEQGKISIFDAPDTEKGKVVKLPDEGIVTYSFKVKKPGRYYVMVRTRGMKNGYIDSSVNDIELERTQLMAYPDYMTWTILAPGKKQGNRISFYDLVPGEKYRIRLRKNERTTEDFEIEGIVVTDSPASFEPR